MNPILEIRGISKKFRIQHEYVPYLSLRDSITSLFSQNEKSSGEDFWALKDISFDVFPGESIGIIGKNGAGKSTLLKILSKITPPTGGKIISRGRIASLLEVGTGFHPELTGRENIFLNGSILGMKRKEIQKKFGEIVDFSAVEKFLDTPLKHYSSGMQLRLAFAVAAFLEPEILLIDEVLAVGDAEFQRKCLGKMDEVIKGGRTVLFVSHNMTAINSLCKNCIYLKNGEIAAVGNQEKVINIYLSGEFKNKTFVKWDESDNPHGDGIAVLLSARTIDEHHQTIESAKRNQKIGIEFTYTVLKEGYMPIPNIHVYKASGECVFICSESNKDILKQTATFTTVMWIPPHLLNEGIYTAGIALSTLDPVLVHFFLQNVLTIEVIDDINLRDNDFKQQIPGVIRPALNWETHILSTVSI